MSNKIIPTRHIIIEQGYPGNVFHIFTTSDPAILAYVEADGPLKDKVINGRTFKEFHRQGEGDGYGYVIQSGNVFYVFESVIGPSNEVLEEIMKTVRLMK